MCIPNPESDIIWNHCVARHISHHHVKFHIEGDFIVPISSLWVHTVVYYKYNTYQKYAIDLWEDFCGFLNKTANSYFVKFIFGNIMNYTNLNYPCPYFDRFYLKVDNFSIEKLLIEPLVPIEFKKFRKNAFHFKQLIYSVRKPKKNSPKTLHPILHNNKFHRLTLSRTVVIIFRLFKCI